MRLFLIINFCILFICSGKLFAQQKDSLSNQGIRNEAIEIRSKLDAYVSSRLGLNKPIDTLSNEYKALNSLLAKALLSNDSLAAQLAKQQARLDSIQNQYLLLLQKASFNKSGNAANGNTLVLLFPSNSSNLSEKAKKELDQQITLLQGKQLTIEGFTDSYGEDSYNQILSMQRARVVSSYLIEKGIQAKLIKYEGKGKYNNQGHQSLPATQCRKVLIRWD